MLGRNTKNQAGGRTAMSDFVPEGYKGFTRRQLLAGAGGMAGAAALAGCAQEQADKPLAAGHASLDLDDPEGNLKALIKLQADLSGADAIGGFGGEVLADLSTPLCRRALFKGDALQGELSAVKGDLAVPAGNPWDGLQVLGHRERDGGLAR